MSEPTDAIDPALWLAATQAMYGRPGMAACKLEFHPYHRTWMFEINHADDSRFVTESRDINGAIRGVLRLIEKAEMPVADFLEPCEYNWSHEDYVAHEAARKYLADSTAEYELGEPKP